VLTFGQITSCCMRRGYAKGNLIMKRPISENGDLYGYPAVSRAASPTKTSSSSCLHS
jgi:hypothetical protein